MSYGLATIEGAPSSGGRAVRSLLELPVIT